MWGGDKLALKYKNTALEMACTNQHCVFLFLFCITLRLITDRVESRHHLLYHFHDMRVIMVAGLCQLCELI